MSISELLYRNDAQWFRSIRMGLIVPTACLVATLVFASPASAASAPEIEAESASHITATDATIEAQINTGGHETAYRVWVGNYPECIEEMVEACDEKTIDGTIAGGSSPASISVDVAKAWHDLSPSSSYIYHVSATNSNWSYEGSAYGANKTFETAAGSAPSIEGLSASHVSGTDATLEAQINTEGLETTYEFNIAWPPCPSLCEHLQHGYPLPAGKLLGSFVTQNVSLDLNSAGLTLTPGERYEYWVTATNAEGTVGNLSSAQTFTASAELPVIESESVSHVTTTDATLEAQVDPNGHNDWAQFQLVEEPGSYASEIFCPEPLSSPGFSGCVGPHSATALPLEFVPGNAANPEAFETITLDLASAGVTLKPGTTYHYRLLAAPAVQTEDTIQWEEPTIFGPDQNFTATSDPPVSGSASSNASSQTVPTGSIAPRLHVRHHHRRHHRRRDHRSSHRSIRGR